MIRMNGVAGRVPDHRRPESAAQAISHRWLAVLREAGARRDCLMSQFIAIALFII
jgi:hypothetical protein